MPLEGGSALHPSAAEQRPNQKVGVRDVADEHSSVECAVVEGTVPSWLEGTLYHQSGGAFWGHARQIDVGDEKLDASFLDGLAHITAFRAKGGKVTFTNRYMRTREFKDFIEKGERRWGGTAGDAGSKPPSKLKSALTKVGSLLKRDRGMKVEYQGFNPNVTLWSLGEGAEGLNRMAAVTEADGSVCEFDPDTLDTIGAPATMPPKQSKGTEMGIDDNNETGQAPRSKGMTITNAAHWFYDHAHAGGFHVALNLEFTITGKFTFAYKIWHGNSPPYRPIRQKEVATFRYPQRAKQPDAMRASYMHTLGQSNKRLVLIESSRRMKYERLIANDMSDGFFGFFESLDIPVRFVVYDIKNGDAGKPPQLVNERTFSLPEDNHFMVWHTANCYDDGDQVILDASAARTDGPASDPMGTGPCPIMRFTIGPLGTKAEPLHKGGDKVAYEFPNINPRFHQRAHRDVYCLSNPIMKGSRVVHIDAKKGTERVLDGMREDEIPTEPVFVPRPGSVEERDGVVLVEVLDTIKEESHLLICECTEKRFAVVARVKAPMACNYGLHSVWMERGSGTVFPCKY